MQYLKEKPQKYLLDGCKMLYYPDKLKDFMNGKRIMPITIDMGIHKSCNMRCVMCYGIFQKPSNDYIPTNSLLAIAEDCRKLDIKGVAIVGDGEPTMNKGLYQFVLALSKNNVASAVATNGLLLDNKKIDILVSNCSWLRFHVSGIRENYPIIHRKTTINDFYRLEKLIRYAVEHSKKATIGLQMVLIPDNFFDIIPFAKWAIELGVDYVQIKQFSDAGSGMPMHFDMNQYKSAENMLKEAEMLSNNKTKIIIKWKALKDSQDITMSKKWDYDRCIDLPFLFQISGNGKCYPCGYLFNNDLFNNDEYCYGDITKERLYDIINSEKYWKIIDKIKNIDMINLCEGQCRHSCGNQFIDRFIKSYNKTKDVEKSLIDLCGSKEQYNLLKNNPPLHIEFI
jgi:MoaA/NifB/PqqE/SkfB family radical SAM enzyme